MNSEVKKSNKKIRKRIILIVAIIIIVAAGVALFMFYPMLTMTPAETGAVDGTDIFAIRNARNAVYFVPADDGYILVDAGSNEQQVVQAMQDNGIDAGDVKWVLITHTDYDHVGALALFSDAEILMSEGELSAVAEKNNFSISTDEISPLTDGQEVVLGGVTVKGISAPGHRAGHMVYLLNGKYLFTGDAFRYDGGEMFVHPFSDDNDTALATIEMLRGVIDGSEIVLTGHYGYYRV